MGILTVGNLRCHVMEVESFEDEGVAKLLNDWFVSIKVSPFVFFLLLLILTFFSLIFGQQ